MSAPPVNCCMTYTNTQIILLIVNIIISALSPIIVAIASLLRHIKKSSCCGGDVEIEPEREKR